MSTRTLFVAALTALAVLAGSCLLCVQARRAFEVSVRSEAPLGLEVHVRPLGISRCFARAFGRAAGFSGEE